MPFSWEKQRLEHCVFSVEKDNNTASRNKTEQKNTMLKGGLQYIMQFDLNLILYHFPRNHLRIPQKSSSGKIV